MIDVGIIVNDITFIFIDLSKQVWWSVSVTNLKHMKLNIARIFLEYVSRS